MRRLQEEIIAKLYVKSEIEPHDEIKRRVQFLKDYMRATGNKKLVLGISGGQDSTLTGKLAQLAAAELRQQTADDEYRFIAVRLPYGTQKDEADAQLALLFIQPDQVFTFNIQSMTDAFVPEFEKATGTPIRDYDKGNVKARIRMVAQYLLGAFEQALVLGTDHAAEAVTGFFTKFGDGAADLTPLTGLTKRQGALLLQTMNAPERLYTKTPTADLLDHRPGQADETELGIAYDALDDYLEGKPVSNEIAEKIEKRYRQTEHKRELPVSPFDTWWK
ncbi:ammonia-dependent NAD(+) synthetase [Paenibacillus allorhizosphaerae]|uniref:NH(3)-dependent NAD(+) synthetase n=1 Tax=Paenibacillus allorhizosphaerae TaxID=2849866 RepID=A0ABM8VF87_9BACL|nr:ammonia-dependent NAD(+) synthetase [Paenibacillus allorhizosphaerae]CAG7633943.1 NH(3)-dependent NAD(+) synthetase [Paenibacillus allorhizosphaerae]